MIVSSSASSGFFVGSGSDDSPITTKKFPPTISLQRRGEKAGEIPSFIPRHSCSRSSGIVTLSFGFRDRHFFVHAITYAGTRRLRYSSFFGGLAELAERAVGVAYSGKSIACVVSGIAFIFW